MRIFWLVLGSMSLGLGGVGIVLPLLPATPFVILSAFCFAKSDPRLHERLLRSPTFGKAICDWRNHRAISWKGKVASVLAMTVSLALSVALGIDLKYVAIQAVVMAAAATFILTRNTAD